MSEELTPPRFPTMLRKMWSGGEVQAWIDENWNRRAQPAAPSDEVAAVLRYCRAVQQEGTVNERVVAQTVARMLAKPPDAAPSVAPEPLHVDETKRYRVVQKGYWWRVQIGDGQQTVGRCFSQTEAQHLAHALVVAYRDGFFVASQAAHPPRAPLTEEFWLMLDTALDALKYHQEQTRPIELTRVTIAAVETFISAHGIGGK